MMYVRWALLAILSLVVTVIALIVAPVLPLFARVESGPCDNANAIRAEPRLPAWLSWFQTPDNSLYGDNGWRYRHCIDGWWTYWGMVRWLWRNPAYGFEWHGPLRATIDPVATMAVAGNPLVQNAPRGVSGYCFTVITNPDGTRYWHLYWVRPIGAGRCLNVNLGWKLKTYAEDPGRIKTQAVAMFCLSPRIAEFVAEVQL